jgi:glutamate-1-semialdehyde aminotransferase
MPVGAFGGRKEIMQHIAPLRKGLPGRDTGKSIALIAGYTVLKELRRINIYKQLDDKANYLKKGLDKVLNSWEEHM